jgi:zinc-ribbon domain
MSEIPARYCGNCGNELDPEDRFCPNCGRPVHQTASVPTLEADVPVPPPPQQEARTQPLEQQEAQPREPWTTRQLALGCFGVFFVVFVVGAFVAALAGNGGGNEAQKNKKGGGGKDTAPKPELVVSSPSASPTVTSDSIEVKGEVTPATSKVTVNGAVPDTLPGITPCRWWDTRHRSIGLGCGHMCGFVNRFPTVRTEAMVLSQFMTTVPAIPVSQGSSSLVADMMPSIGVLRIW